jgi:molecular chaperone DnaK
VVAAVRDGVAGVLADADGRAIHPSVISFHPSGSVLVGHDAKKRRLVDPRSTIASVKRLIGRPFSSPEAQEFLRTAGFVAVEGPNQQVLIQVRDQQVSVPEVSAHVLHHLRTVAERALRRTVSRAVITVPASFNDAQRSATAQAGEIAGLEVIRIINEPTAAALAYGHGKGLHRRVLIYDLGGGTFDVTLLDIHGEVYEVLATAGDNYLGGDDMDRRLVDHLVEQGLREHGVDLREHELAMPRLYSVAEQLKCQLSAQPRARVRIEEIASGPGGHPIDLELELTREQLGRMIEDVVDRTFSICDEVFRLASLPVSAVDEVVLVGGATRVPLVRDSVRSYFSRAPQTRINPDEVVALGAAIQAAALAGMPLATAGPVAGAPGALPFAVPAAAIQPLLLDVTPLSLGIATVGGFTQVIIPRNARVPAEQTRIFATGADQQTSVTLRICQGEARRFEENTVLGALELTGLRPALRGEVKVEVTFALDTSGRLQVRAQDPVTGTAQEAAVRLLGQLSTPEVDAARARQAAPAPRA